jgi:hypothetical protein
MVPLGDQVLRTRKIAATVAIVSILTAMPVGAAQDSKLRAVRGTVGYQTSSSAPFSRVFGSFIVADNDLAVTQAASNGLLQLADSSGVALGDNTTVQVGQITQAASAAAPTTMTLVAGSVRFAIKHPAGGQSNYRFVTSTSQLAVRGTVGLYSTGPNGDVVTCLDCAPGDVTVTAGGNTTALLTGQTATISAAGVITVGATVAATVASSTTSAFAQAGLNVTNSVASFAPGIGTATAATTTAITAGAAAVAAGAGIAISNAVAATPTPASIAVPINASSERRVTPTKTPTPAAPMFGGTHHGP